MDLPPVDPATQQFVLGGGALALLGLVARFIVRAISRDRTMLAGDSSERVQIKRLEQEIELQSARSARDLVRETERADRAEARAEQYFVERNEAIGRANELTGQITQLRQEVHGLKEQVESLRQLLGSFYIKGPRPPDPSA